ncbi:MAG: 30S ribosomal protein S20 [Patescibacteria group bacterium]|nr:30S ribosomal protein S20 [Patescibacteria group bacterium]
MPIIKSAQKKMRSDSRKRQHNLRRKSAVKQALKAMDKEPTKENFSVAQKALDKAAKTNVIHKNKAARLKKRLFKKIA